MSLSHVRHGLGAVRPYVYGRMDTADLIARVFDGEELENLDAGNGAHIEARIGDAMIVLEVSEPPHPGGSPSSIYVYVRDVDETLRRAREAGFEIIAEAADKPYQERAGGLKDSYGNTWWVSTFHGNV
jgi:PhnB protein